MSESDSQQTVEVPQPVAWANEDDDGLYEIGLSEAKAQYILERAPNRNYSHRNPRIVPLYRSPTLTDEEREALTKVVWRIRGDYFTGRFADSVQIVTVIDGLLERTK